jgi:thiamine biosynthesis lipoprotein
VSEIRAAEWSALGTTASVVVTHAPALPAARRAVEAELAELDAACSRFRDDSELMRLNARAGEWVRVSRRLREAIATALRAAALTDGIVDPTVGNALLVLGYDRDFSLVRESPPALTAVRVAGWKQIRIDHAARKVRVPRGVVLDLGATAKALGADRAATRAAAAAPGAGVLVNLGGDIATAGPAPPDGWLVRVTDDHRAPLDAYGQTVTIESGGLATSSTTVRRWGDDAHHIIDPRTGLPAASPWRTVSVCAATCVDANVASTAALVLGELAGSWLEHNGLPARLVDHDGLSELTAGWPRELAPA